ncbi:hypothetical protein D3C73_1007830 [compost metagenome]
MRFVGVTVSAAVAAAETGCVVRLSIHRCQVDVVGVIFQTAAVSLCLVTTAQNAGVVIAVLIVGTVGREVRRCSADTVAQIVRRGHAVTVTVLRQHVTTVVGFGSAVVFALVLQSKVQAVNQTKEV